MQGHIHKRIRKDIRLTKPINDKSPAASELGLPTRLGHHDKRMLRAELGDLPLTRDSMRDLERDDILSQLDE